MSLGIEILGYFFECTLQMLCIYALLGKKIKVSIKETILISIYIILLLLVNKFDFPKSIIIVNILILYAYIILVFRIKFVHAVVAMLLNLLISSSAQMIISYPVIKILKQNVTEIENTFIINALSVLLMIVIVKLIKFSTLYSKIIKWDKLIVRTTSVVFVLFSLLYVRYKIEGEMTLFAYFISALLICVVVKLTLNWSKDRYEIKQKSLELHMHELYGKTFEGMIENIRIRQHDFKNQLAAIYGMHLTAETFEELVENQKKYCDYLMEESRYDSILIKCNDKILAGFLYTKFTELDKKGIDVQFDISLNNSKCKLATYELIEITGILIDNAAEAELGKIENGNVEFVIRDNKDIVTIISRNLSKYIDAENIRKFFKRGYSTKGDERGFGLYNVKRILDGKGEIIVSNISAGGKNYIEFKIEIKR